MNNATAYLVMFPHGVNSASQDFQKLFSEVTAKTQILPNVFLIHSDTGLSQWYSAAGTGAGTTTTGATSGSIGLTVPVVLPVNLDAIKGTKGVPAPLMTVINQYAQAA